MDYKPAMFSIEISEELKQFPLGLTSLPSAVMAGLDPAISMLDPRGKPGDDEPRV